MEKRLYVVILAGGQGVRLWPLSRRKKSKHLLRVTSNRSLLQQAYNRICPPVERSNILVVTTLEQENDIMAQLPTLPAENLLVEPLGRNTAVCVGLAATVINARSKNSIMAVLTTDHAIRPSFPSRVPIVPDTPLANGVQIGEQIFAVGRSGQKRYAPTAGMVTGIHYEDGVEIIGAAIRVRTGLSESPLLNKKG